ncbi:ABC transporter ATP-binding protein [Arthrobacter castelli]|uniref:ABC transporter ATP-binding protein n=1 Tax=Arthrobacter castelli TaxID=271431 RepID=UPI00041592A1|nr:ATP-binding cassette domain-containing protein [Arthrobacter castelli]
MLRIENLRRTFGDVTAVDDVSFTVEPGRMTGFVGANGAGKTTTMRMIMGVLAIHSGQVEWNGRPITAADRTRFGYMPEERGLYPKQQVLDQLVYLGQLRGMSQGDARREGVRLLGRFELEGRQKDKLESLSLGNQQRVQIVAALLHRPTALILDEPFSGLDPVAVDSMADLLRERISEGTPVLFSSHQLDLMERLCDNLVVLSHGRLVAAGDVAELRHQQQQRHRVVTEPDAGWLRELGGVTVLDVEGPKAVVEIVDAATRRTVVEEALKRGGLDEFTPLVPSLSEIYREVTQ